MKKEKDETKKGLGGAAHIVGNIVGILLIAILLPVMCVNLTLIIKSYTQPDQVPTVLGIAPLIVQSGSMQKTIMVDDLIFTRKVDAATLKKGDIIAFQPAGEITVVTHRIVELVEEDGVKGFRMKGDANNTTDAEIILKSQIVGKYFMRIAGGGKVARVKA